MTKFDFTEEELQLNKKGILSSKQKGVLKSMAGSMRSSWRSGVWVILFFLGLGTCIMSATFLQGMDMEKLRTRGPQLLIGLCFAVFAVFAITAFGIFTSYRQAAKLESASVLVAEGVISHGRDYSANSGITSHYVYFGKKRFSFPNDMTRTFSKGSMYRIYYCKVGQIELIMSFEKTS
jgi:hypothetical protein